MSIFLCREPGDESFEEVAAYDVATAVEDFAEQVYDAWAGEVDPSIGLTIETMDVASGVVTRWHVEIEYAPTFSAYQEKPK